MSKLLNVSSSPHVRSHETTHSIMLDVEMCIRDSLEPLFWALF